MVQQFCCALLLECVRGIRVSCFRVLSPSDHKTDGRLSLPLSLKASSGARRASLEGKCDRWVLTGRMGLAYWMGLIRGYRYVMVVPAESFMRKQSTISTQVSSV